MDAFAKVMKVTIIFEFWTVVLAWYSPIDTSGFACMA